MAVQMPGPLPYIRAQCPTHLRRAVDGLAVPRYLSVLFVIDIVMLLHSSIRLARARKKEEANEEEWRRGAQYTCTHDLFINVTSVLKISEDLRLHIADEDACTKRARARRTTPSPTILPAPYQLRYGLYDAVWYRTVP